MVDLEKLSKMCKEKKRWTFFVTSAPANVPGKSRFQNDRYYTNAA